MRWLVAILAVGALVGATVGLHATARRAADRPDEGLAAEPEAAAAVGDVGVEVNGGFVRAVAGDEVEVRATRPAPAIALTSAGARAATLRLRVANAWQRGGTATWRVSGQGEPRRVRRGQAAAVSVPAGERLVVSVAGPPTCAQEFEFVVVEGGGEDLSSVHAVLRDLTSDPPAFVVYRDRGRGAGGAEGAGLFVEIAEAGPVPVFVVGAGGQGEGARRAPAPLVGPPNVAFAHAGSWFVLLGSDAGGSAGEAVARLKEEAPGSGPPDHVFVFVPTAQPPANDLAQWRKLDALLASVPGAKLCFRDAAGFFRAGTGRTLRLAVGMGKVQGSPGACPAWRVRVRRDGRAYVVGSWEAASAWRAVPGAYEAAALWRRAARRKPWLAWAGAALVGGWAALLGGVVAWVLRELRPLLSRRPVEDGRRSALGRLRGVSARLGRALLVVAALGAVGWLYLGGLGVEHIAESNEGNRVQATREMLATRDYVVPHVNGRVYLTKPPLYYWSSLLAWLDGGELSEFRARLPGVAAGLACLGVVFLFARRWFGAGAGALSALVLALSPLFWLQAREAELDMLLCALTTLSLCLLLTALEAVRSRRLLFVAAFAALAGATLTKGPVPLAIAAATLLVFLLWTRRVAWRCGGGLVLGLVTLVALVGPWCWAVAERVGWEPARAMLVAQTVRRVQRASAINAAPWHFYLPRLAATFFPWSLWLPAAALVAWRASRWWRDLPEARAALFLGAWAVPSLALFSACAGKETQYILPLFPPLAMLCGLAASRWRELDVTRAEGFFFGAGTLLAGVGLVAAALGAVAATGASFRGLGTPGEFPSLVGAALAASVAGGAVVACWRRRALGGVLAAVVLAFLAAKAFHESERVPRQNAARSPRAFCRRAAEMLPPRAELFMVGFERSRYSLYTGRIARHVASVSDKLRAAKNAYWLVKESTFLELKQKHGALGRCLLAAHAGKPVLLIAPQAAGPARAGPPPPSESAR